MKTIKLKKPPVCKIKCFHCKVSKPQTIIYNGKRTCFDCLGKLFPASFKS